jgi:hypothetical protein
MPFTINGIGTGITSARGFVKWPGMVDHDRDACECLVVFFMPVIAYKTMHTFDWNGDQYKAIPIRYSFGMVLRAYVRSWLGWAPMCIGLVMLLVAVVAAFDQRGGGRERLLPLTMFAVSVPSLALSGLTFFLLGRTDRRNIAIRRALGRHEFGSSDPADWTGDLASAIGPGEERPNKLSYLAAARHHLGRGEYSDAMWNARLGCIAEDRAEAERMTDEILADDGFRGALFRLGKSGEGWEKLMNGSGATGADAAAGSDSNRLTSPPAPPRIPDDKGFSPL